MPQQYIAPQYHDSYENAVSTFEINSDFVFSSGTTQPYIMMPAMYSGSSPKIEVDDSPLAWLRSQVEEVTELARAA